MKARRHNIAEIIANKTLSGGSVKSISQSTAAYLLGEGRRGELDSLIRDVMQARIDRGVIDVKAISRHPLNDQVRAEISTRIKALYPKAKKIIISEQLDSSVIAGIRLELANQQLDLTIESKLNKFKQLIA